MRCLEDPSVHLTRLLDMQPLGTGLDVADLGHPHKLVDCSALLARINLTIRGPPDPQIYFSIVSSEPIRKPILPDVWTMARLRISRLGNTVEVQVVFFSDNLTFCPLLPLFNSYVFMCSAFSSNFLTYYPIVAFLFKLL